MKIAFLLDAFPVLSETFILNQITGLIDNGNEVSIFARRYQDRTEIHPDVMQYNLLKACTYLEQPPSRRLTCLNEYLRMLIRFVHYQPSTLSRLITLLGKQKIKESLARTYTLAPLLVKPFDILQCHYANNGLSGIHLKRLGCRAKVVTMFHGHDIRTGIENNGTCYNDLWQYGDCYLSISRYTSDHIIRFGADPSRIVHHPVGIDTTKFPFRRPAMHSGSRAGFVRLISVARLVPEKGLSHALQAIRKMLDGMPDLAVEYRIIGEGPLQQGLENQAHELGLTDIVTFLGGANQSVVQKELADADIFLLPSMAEVLPAALMEAQSTGLPAVASDVGGVCEIILDKRSGYLVPPGKPDVLADCLGRIILQRNRWEEMGRIGSSFIAKHFDIMNLNERLETIYTELMHNRKPCLPDHFRGEN